MKTSFRAFAYCFIFLAFCSKSYGFAPQSMPVSRTAPGPTSTAIGYQNGESPEFATLGTIANGKWHQRTSNKRDSLSNKSIIQNLASPNELLAFLDTPTTTAVDHDFVVVLFYASWCKKCQKVGMQMKRVAKKFGNNFRFARFECTPSTQAFLVQAMGVEKVPSLRIYKRRKQAPQELVFNAGSDIKGLFKELLAMESAPKEEHFLAARS